MSEAASNRTPLALGVLKLTWIVDTDVLVALRHPVRSSRVAQWLAEKPEADLFLSVVTLGELQRYVGQVTKRTPSVAEEIRGWGKRTVQMFEDRLLPFDADAALLWGVLSQKLERSSIGLMIAATALTRNATVVTFRSSDFEAAGVLTANPFH